MVEDEIWARMSPEQVTAVKQALAVVATSGVLKAQLDLEGSRLLDQAPDTSQEQLMVEVQQYRSVAHGINMIHNYGLKLAQEIEENTNA